MRKNTKKLNDLGENIRQTGANHHKKFNELAKGCPHRSIVISDMFSDDDEGEHMFSCNHPERKDSFEWWCYLISCPHTGATHPTKMAKPSKKEIKDYEDSRRTKED